MYVCTPIQSKKRKCSRYYSRKSCRDIMAAVTYSYLEEAWGSDFSYNSRSKKSGGITNMEPLCSLLVQGEDEILSTYLNSVVNEEECPKPSPKRRCFDPEQVSGFNIVGHAHSQNLLDTAYSIESIFKNQPQPSKKLAVTQEEANKFGLSAQAKSSTRAILNQIFPVCSTQEEEVKKKSAIYKNILEQYNDNSTHESRKIDQKAVMYEMILFMFAGILLIFILEQISNIRLKR